jgi:hypothetical protein
MVSPRRDPGRPPANVAESWRRIEAWLGEHLPAVRASLRDGVTKRDLNKFLTVTDFGGADGGIRRGTRRSTGFAANSRGSDAG